MRDLENELHLFYDNKQITKILNSLNIHNKVEIEHQQIIKDRDFLRNFIFN
jgi:hypothetical protein